MTIVVGFWSQYWQNCYIKIKRWLFFVKSIFILKYRDTVKSLLSFRRKLSISEQCCDVQWTDDATSPPFDALRVTDLMWGWRNIEASLHLDALLKLKRVSVESFSFRISRYNEQLLDLKSNDTMLEADSQGSGRTLHKSSAFCRRNRTTTSTPTV